MGSTMFEEENPISSEHFNLKINGRSKRDIHLENMADHYDVTLMLSGKAVPVRLTKYEFENDSTLESDVESGNFSGYGFTWMIYKAKDVKGVFIVRRQITQDDIKIEGYLNYKNAFYLVQPNSTTGHVMHQLNEQRENTAEENEHIQYIEKIKRRTKRNSKTLRTLKLRTRIDFEGMSLLEAKNPQKDFPSSLSNFGNEWYIMMTAWVASQFEELSRILDNNEIKVVPHPQKILKLGKRLMYTMSQTPVVASDKVRKVACALRTHAAYDMYRRNWDMGHIDEYTILLSGNELVDEFGNKDVSAKTDRGCMCRTGGSVFSLVEFGFNLLTLQVITRNIARAMGARYDNDPMCRARPTNFIMTSKLNVPNKEDGNLFYEWSDCSASSVDYYLGKAYWCVNNPDTSTKVEKTRLGSAMTYDQQCKLVAGLAGTRASNANQQPSSKICISGLECNIKKDDMDKKPKLFYFTPFDGTNCGNGMACKRGQCV